ncbi:MAG TPA: pilus assembly protein N-terminal domain-containing protein [Fimbriiglobus sp.]|nr:pilus assembly protein N-terminal domain-containing protein [Fimbriiglobus sp.]
MDAPPRFGSSNRLSAVAVLLFAALSGTAAAVANPPATGTSAEPGPLPVPTSPLIGPECPPANAGLPERLPLPPVKPPRPATGPGSVAEFAESISQNDAGFEVLVGQGRVLTTRVDLAARGKPPALVAVGDPTVADFAVVSARQIRIEGRRIGVTDLSIVTPDNQTYQFEVRVVADLHVLRGQLHCLFPDASLKLTQVRDHVVIEGQARDSAQVARILETVKAYLLSVQTGQLRQVTAQQQGPGSRPPGEAPPAPANPPRPGDAPAAAGPEQSPLRSTQATVPEPRVINLIRVPGSRQVLLKVRVAELNRTAFRQIGADLLAVDTTTGAIAGTRIGGATSTASGGIAGRALTGFAQTVLGGSTTAFGIFEQGDFAVLLSALRRNSLLRVLAEPNLVAMDGHAASFLAGGEFPIPVPQTGGGGISPTITVQFREFGVRLGFLPTILDGEVIRLAVDPEVSTIDQSLGTVLVPGGSPVPGLNTRKVHTVVEMREGQTLAIAGLLQLTMDGSTQRIPGLGDLPILGPFFSNTTNTRVEKELIVLVTPYLVEPMRPEQVPPSPGDEVKTPTDLEFYLLNRIEGRTGYDWRSTTQYDNRLPIVRCLLRLDAAHVRGPHGYCE